MPKARVGDLNLHYDVRGAGDPLLLIMGLGASSAAWDPEMLAQLARSFQVIAFDNRGTGELQRLSFRAKAAEAKNPGDHLYSR
jgi:pimeloyl-ACP methyl ester carboxylesterase